jgi:hypothetical protein
MHEPTALRPIERRVLFPEESGLDRTEIAMRFRRSPEFIGRVVELARLPNRRPTDDQATLRPLERRILAWREQGVDYSDIAPRFRRSPDFVARVERFANYKLALR